MLWPTAPGLAQQDTNTAQQRDLIVQLRRAEDLLATGEPRQGLTMIHRIIVALEGTDDVVLPAADGSMRSLKQQCYEHMRAASAEDIKFYESQFGTEARDRLQRARRTGDLEELEAVSRRYFFTQAGAAATRELALRLLDQGRSLDAALQLSRFRREAREASRGDAALAVLEASAWAEAGVTDEVHRILASLRAGNVSVRGTAGPLLPGAEGSWPDWLPADRSRSTRDQWPVFLGNLSRNRETGPAVPLWQERWQADPLTSEVVADSGGAGAMYAEGFWQIRSAIQTTQRWRSRGQSPTVPVPTPLVVRDRLIFRGPLTIKAIRLAAGDGLEAGELEWESVNVDPHFERAIQAFSEGDSASIRRQAQSYAFEDLTSSTLASDGSFVYAIEGTDRLADSIHFSRFRATPIAESMVNYLRAYELESGMLAWQIGGERGIRVAGMRDAVFLGPPLPFGRDLLLIVASRDEIRLLQLRVDVPFSVDPQLRVVWSQRLARADAQAGLSTVVRLSGLSPTFGGGLLLCPTESGEIVALDPATRSVRWRYHYSQPDIFPGGSLQPQWLDSAIRMIGDYAICSPRDSDEVFCLHVRTGQLLWSHARGGAHMVVPTASRVLCIGSQGATAINVADGSIAWSDLGAFSNPSGRPLLRGHSLTVPLLSGQAVTLDTRTGRVLARSESGQVLGNLLAVGDVIVSQSAINVTVFSGSSVIREEIEQQLAARPATPTWLMARAVLALQEGRQESGLRDLAVAAAQPEGSAAAEMLLTVVSELDRSSFRRYAHLLQGLDAVERLPSVLPDGLTGPALLLNAAMSRLHVSPRLRLALLDLTDVNDGSARDPQARFESAAATLLDLARNVSSGRFVLIENRVISEPRYLAARVRDQLSGPETMPAIRRLQQSVRDELTAGRVSQALYLTEWIPQDRIDETLTADLASALVQSQPGQSVRLWLPLTESENVPIRVQAVSQCVQLLRDRRPDLTRSLIRRLQREESPPPEVVELLQSWRSDPAMTGVAPDRPAWPPRAPTIDRRPNAGSIVPRTVPVDSLRDVAHGGWQFERDGILQLIARDSRLQKQLEIPIPASVDASFRGEDPYVIETPTALVARLGGRSFQVFDLLSTAAAPKVLWEGTLQEATGEAVDLNGRQQRSMYPRAVGPVAGGLVLYQDGDWLTAADLWTGEVAWRYSVDLRQKSVVADDQQVAIVSGSYGGTVELLRAFDGRKLGLRRVRVPPDVVELLAAVDRGRLLLAAGKDEAAADGDVRLLLMNYGEDQPRWQHSFPRGSVVSPCVGGFCAAVEPQGKISVVRVTDGEIVAAGDSEPVGGLSGVVLHLAPDQFVVFTDKARQRLPVIGRSYSLDQFGMVSGIAVGFDRLEGQLLWSVPVDDERLPIDLSSFQRPRLVARNLPLLVLLSANGPAGLSYRVLDCRTGATLFRSPEPERTMVCLVNPLPEQAAIEFQVGRSLLRADFAQAPE